VKSGDLSETFSMVSFRNDAVPDLSVFVKIENRICIFSLRQ